MELKAGYKQTEVGVIPETWQCCSLGDVVDLLTGLPFPSAGYVQSGVRLLRGSNVKRGCTDWTEKLTVYWPSITTEVKKYSLKAGDVVVAMDGSLVGRSFAFLGENDVPSLLLQRVARIRSDRLAQTYLKVWVCSQRFTNHCDTVKTASAIPHISPSDIRSFKVAFPPTKAEQEAIAEALSDADALIESLDQLIAKKRQIKQGAMQELLTGKRRLPGFSGEWRVRCLNELAVIDPEQLSSNTQPEYEFKYISLEDVDFGALRGHSFQVFRYAPSRARRRLRVDDLLVSTVRPNLKSHLWFRDRSANWVCSTGFSVVRCLESVSHPGYVFAHLFADGIAKQIDALLTGSNYPAINSRDVRQLQVPVPSLEEQTAIATILSDMDTELAALESRLAKARQIKQGMMQELLTGRIRLL